VSFVVKEFEASCDCYNGDFRTLLREESSILACPYFMPVAKLENGSWPHPARLPLGCGWSGYCTAPGHENESPTQDILESFCNLGYATGCSWAPTVRSWDCVRFSVSAPLAVKPEKGVADVPGSLLHLTYVCERDHRPVDHGELEFDLARSIWLRRHGDARIQKMAQCFLESYRKRRG